MYKNTKTDKHYFNNGKIEVRVKECPKDFVVGRLPENIKKTSEGHLGIKKSEESKRKCSQSMKGKNKGKISSEETRLKISKALKGKCVGKKSYINYSTNERRYFYETDIIPEGFVKGTPKISEEMKKRISEKEKGKKISEETKKKISTSRKGKGHALSEECKRKLSSSHKSKSTQMKMYNSKKKNKTFNTSKDEQDFEKELNLILSDTEYETNYIDERYPFKCDFYIKKLDLFIELNHHWTHGKHPFNPYSEEDKRILKIWYERSENSKFYKIAIKVWTEKDYIKIKKLKDNKLNFKLSYTKTDMYEILDFIKIELKKGEK